jgi:hypothetical protein
VVRKRRALLVVAVGYGLWTLLAVFITMFRIGDGGVSAHLGLLLTGFPLSLLSLWLPHGTMVGVLVAGVLGFVQWFAIVTIYASPKR